MLLKLDTIGAEGRRIERRFEPSAFDADEARAEFRVVAPVLLDFEIRRGAGDTFGVSGRVETTLELPCGRCLEPFAHPVAADFELSYLPQAANTGEGEREVERDDLTTAYYRDDQLDLGHLMREQFYLAMPMKALCGPECRGLCPVCGINRNVSSCRCDTTWHDPRLAGLKALLDGERSD